LIDQINVDLTPFKSPQLKKLYWRKPMWKLVVGFIVFAGLALYVISKGGDSLDMSGEKHGAEAVHSPAPAPAAPATTAAPAAADAAPAAPATTPATAPAAAPAPASK
jgi:hypothetical protein